SFLTLPEKIQQPLQPEWCRGPTGRLPGYGPDVGRCDRPARQALPRRLKTFALQGGEHPASAPVVAVLAEVDTLPGAQRQPPIGYRQAHVATEQAGFEMGRQIVRPFVIMLVTAFALGHQAVEETLEIAPDRAIGVLVDGQRGRGVLQPEV